MVVLYKSLFPVGYELLLAIAVCQCSNLRLKGRIFLIRSSPVVALVLGKPTSKAIGIHLTFLDYFFYSQKIKKI